MHAPAIAALAPALMQSDSMVKSLVGQRFGPYEIGSLLGSGGMGEVYRARDTMLGRDVAIKILPRLFSVDADRRARFEREARLLAALNHPHIGAIYGFERRDEIHGLVLELVEGSTLAERLRAGPVPVRETLTIARQIAEALEAAHEKGIVHRDLKPANIMITRDGVVKVLDFGLAKAGADESARDLTHLPTLTVGGTYEGVILGTAPYMSPEQARGTVVDKRTDIWAFGCVVWEMLTGGAAFAGETVSDTIAAILEREPNWSVLPSATPAGLTRLLKRCLEKDPKRRLHDIADARIEIDDALQAPVPMAAAEGRAPARRLRIALGTAAALAIAFGIWAGVRWWRIEAAPPMLPPAAQESVRFSVSPPQDAAFTGGPNYAPAQALSPDGRRMVFRAQRPGGPDLLWVRSLDSLEARALPGTEGGDFPFWSPDSRFIGFFAQGKLKKIDVAGGPAQTLCDAPTGEGGTWNRDGIIVFAPTGVAGLSQVSAAGGEPIALTAFDSFGKEISHRWPQFLPDGRHFLFLVQPANTVRVGSLDSRETKTLLPADSKVLYAAPGYLLFMREGTLIAQPFDASRVELTGDASPVAEHVRGTAANGRAAFSVSENGVLAYRTGLDNVTQMTWLDRSGKLLQSIGQPGPYLNVDLSPDEGRAVVTSRESLGRGNLWLVDMARGTTSRFTFTPSVVDAAPYWSSDGRHIVFTSDRDGGIRNLYQKVATGAGQQELLLKSGANKASTSWSSDGRYIVYDSDDPKTGTDLWVLPLFGDRKPMPFLRTEFNEGHGRISPDGRWMAYASDETGRYEVYVQPFPVSGAKWQISASGGVQPRWRRDGKEIFYLAAAGVSVMAVEVRATTTAFEAGTPTALFRTLPGFATPGGVGAGTNTQQPYAVSADGQRFLILSPTAETPSDPITVVLNWMAELKK